MLSPSASVAVPAPKTTAIRHFYDLAEWSRQELDDLLDLALRMKALGPFRAPGKKLGMLFFNPSLRTRMSFEAAMANLGGHALVMQAGKDSWTLEFSDGTVMDGATQEHIRDAARVMSRYVDILAVRSSELMTTASQTAAAAGWPEQRADTVLRGFMRHATVPVINMESNVFHPCQALADALTMREKLGDMHGRKVVVSWTYHPKALPLATPHSQLLAAAALGAEVSLAHPEGWDLDEEVVARAHALARDAGGSLAIGHDRVAALDRADVVIAKSWASLAQFGDWEAERAARSAHRDWLIDDAALDRTAGGHLMHCLPVRRGVEVSHEVLDGGRSWAIDEAENRLWAQQALLYRLLGAGGE